MARAKLETFVTPVAEAVFPSLTTPYTEYDPDGVYTCSVVMPPEIADELIERLERVRDEFATTLTAAERAKYTAKPVFREEMTRPTYPEGASDEEREEIRNNFIPEPTGNVMFVIKMKRKITTRDGKEYTQEPIVVSAEDGSAVTEQVWGGSLVRVKGQVSPYKMASSKEYGVSLRLKSVQVHELVTGSESATEWTNFDNDE